MKTCTKCNQEKSLDSFNKDKTRKDGLFPHCRSCTSLYKKVHRESHKEELEQKKREWRAKNKDKVRDYFAKYRANNREAINASQAKYLSKNKDVCSSRIAEWRKSNQAKQLAYRWERIAKQEQRTPAWADKNLIRLVYEFSAELGTDYEVDHIYPIRGEMVSGLHVPQNLRVIKRSSNRSKGNKMPVEDFAPTVCSFSFQDFVQQRSSK